MSSLLIRQGKAFSTVRRDRIFHSVKTVKRDKIPQYRGFANFAVNPTLGQIGNEPGMEGDVIIDRTTGNFCWHDGTNWRCSGDFVTITNLCPDPPGESLVVGGDGPDLSIKGLLAGAGVTLTSDASCVTIATSGSGGLGICLATTSDQTIASDTYIGLGDQSNNFTDVSMVAGADKTFTSLTFSHKGTAAFNAGGDQVTATLYTSSPGGVSTATALTVTITKADNDESPPVVCKTTSANVSISQCDEFAVFIEPVSVGSIKVSAALMV